MNHEPVEKLEAKLKIVMARLKLVDSNINIADSATRNALEAEKNRLIHAIAAAGSDITPNPPGAAACCAIPVAGHKE